MKGGEPSAPSDLLDEILALMIGFDVCSHSYESGSSSFGLPE